MQLSRWHWLAALAALALAEAALAQPGDVIPVPPVEEHRQRGFHMEGPAEVEMVFGDVETFQGHVDDLYELAAAMDEARQRFGRHSKALIDAIAGQRRGCPAGIGGHLQAQLEAGQRFAELGTRLTNAFRVVMQYDELGETAGLTPDYRWKVTRARELYRDALRDYHEMRIETQTQIGAELIVRRCPIGALLAEDRTAPPEPAAPSEPAADLPSSHSVGGIGAASATFFVDNRGCPHRVDVFVGGELLGQVGANTKSAFQYSAGRRTMCLILEDSAQQCGQQGTLREAYIHDGWEVTMRCF